MPFSLDLSEAKPLLARVSNIFSPGVSDQILLVAGRAVGAKAEELVSPYPHASGKALPLFYTRTYAHPKANGPTTYKSKFKSLAQQRKVMALVKQGKVPYKRTGTLGKSILASDPELRGPGLVIVSIGSKLNYAPYVIDQLMQSHYHLGTWTPLQEDMRRAMPELKRATVNAVVKDINRRLNSNG